MSNRIPKDKIEKIVGKENVLIQSGKMFVYPVDITVISEIIKLAIQEKFKLLPLGSGSILDWSKLPSENMVVLKSDRLNKIVKVVPEDLYVILQAGFPLKDLNPQLQSFNLFYPLTDNNSHESMGGLVATNLKGKSGDKNLQTTEYVLALEIIDSQGQILNVGARTFKSVTGYDLPRLYVGSWGTLGFISEISLRVVPISKRKHYPSFVSNPPLRNPQKGQNDMKAVLSSHIKDLLDPNQIFFTLESLP